ncbi:MAG: SulP family inorganic anion transporter, partial [Rhodospirillales bacterium]|nr:SulP family inorganic anion transporter [Rhodospirillales bacterium]
FFAALFGGTPSQISGPTGPMTVVMAAIFVEYSGAPGLAFAVIIMGGLFQIIFGWLRLGSFISLVPFTVISGFMSGIGVIIIILQLAPLFGHAAGGSGVIGGLMQLPSVLADIKWDAALVGLGVLLVVWVTPSRIARILPPPLLALVAGTLVVTYYLPGVSVLGEIPTGFPKISLPSLSLDQLPGMVGWALVLAFLGSIDSLLTSLVADSVTRTHHLSNRELFGQGIGNVVAGLFGGIPGAGATMRTLVNVRSGGRTPVSGMIHALILLAIVLGLGPLASHIPHTVLAGILIKVGIDIIDWGYIRRAPRAPRSGVVIMAMVLGLTVFVDLIVAFATGMIAASLLFMKRMTDLQLQSVRATGTEGWDDGGPPLGADEEAILENCEDAIVLYHFGGPISFGAAKGIAREFKLDEHRRALVLDFSDVPMIDTTGAFAVDDILEKAGDMGAAAFIAGLRPPVASVLERLGVLDRFDPARLCPTRLEALQAASRLIHAPAGDA